MNKKGQVLILFVLLIPVFLMLLAFVIDIGFLYIEDKKIESSIKESIQYGLENIDNIDIQSKIDELITKNINNALSIQVHIDNGYIYVSVEKKYQGMFKSLFKNNIYVMNNSYYGYIEDNKLIINKE